MISLNRAGFTIIETMLFLAITGLLVLGVLVGTGNSINIQRYRDSITSLQAFFQQQYSDVSNISNDNLNNVCNGNNSPRGQSDCVILGSLITTSTVNGLSSGLLVRPVLGYIPANSTQSLDDVQIFKNSNGPGKPIGYNITIPPNITSQTYNIEWGASLVPAGNNSAAHFSVLIVRSPSSGIVRTFIDPNVAVNNTVQSLVNAAGLTTPIKTCVNSNGLFNGNKMAVQIIAGSTSSSGVETLGDNSGC